MKSLLKTNKQKKGEGCPISESVQAQLGWGFEPPPVVVRGVVEGVQVSLPWQGD